MTDLDRRTFLSAAAAARTPARRVRIGFLGTTHSHAADKLAYCRVSPDWEVVAVSEEPAPILRDRSIEVVAVEGDVRTNGDHALAALEAGKHVHLEKPPTATLALMKRLVDAARRRNLRLQSGYMWRLHPGFLAITEAAQRGWLGDVYLVRGTMNDLIDAGRRPGWARFAGGDMFEQGCHILDAIVRLLGRPRKLTPYLRKHGAFADTLKDNTAAVLEYPHALALVTAAVLQPNADAHRFFEILGANGTAVLRPIEPPVLEIDLARAAGPYPPGRTRVTLPRFKRYTADFDELARAVRDGKNLSVSLDQEMLVQEIVLTASEML